MYYVILNIELFFCDKLIMWESISWELILRQLILWELISWKEAAGSIYLTFRW